MRPDLAYLEEHPIFPFLVAKVLEQLCGFHEGILTAAMHPHRDMIQQLETWSLEVAP